MWFYASWTLLLLDRIVVYNKKDLNKISGLFRFIYIIFIYYSVGASDGVGVGVSVGVGVGLCVGGDVGLFVGVGVGFAVGVGVGVGLFTCVNS